MSPMWLIAEGPMPGRPSLLGKYIEIRGDPESIADTYSRGRVIHEDSSGVILDSGVSAPYTFYYKLLPDGGPAS